MVSVVDNYRFLLDTTVLNQFRCVSVTPTLAVKVVGHVSRSKAGTLVSASELQ